ncbi:5-formyltetrahydrofolate cyclo-ligase [Microbacterium candidum]|uniref:5-formyltetrahydrofolate cyclo-ligase n=1 Tax=Microbacterium candidum TaxID=3041922 RepID=A0ABT7N3G1_9MICO|nr:5-formyltetrahydrofolate cyclo-ligase [Microbacterium sp. ASV49]MDL9981228.1 5-formyltetrahydrofolate cyclo-ligase [Microbacterium sp. ASV49]
MGDGTDNAKRALRADLRERRQAMSQSAREAAADSLRRNLDALVDRFSARTISCFLSTPIEPGTRRFVTDAVGRGIRVLLPVTRADGLLDWAVADPEGEIAEGLFGQPEPVGELLGPIALDEADLLLIPAAAVDRTGMRLGWGRGFFDKTLGSMNHCPPVYAVVYDSEVLDIVPRDAHDEPVTGAVTPTQIIEFERSAR